VATLQHSRASCVIPIERGMNIDPVCQVCLANIEPNDYIFMKCARVRFGI